MCPLHPSYILLVNTATLKSKYSTNSTHSTHMTHITQSHSTYCKSVTGPHHIAALHGRASCQRRREGPSQPVSDPHPGAQTI